MKNLKTILKENKALVLIIMLAAVVLMGSSYAWYTISIESNKTHTITAGTLELTLNSKEETISLVNAVPTSDAEGLKNKAYHFTITNTGSLNSRYSIYLEDVALTSGASRMSDSVIKYNLSSTTLNTTAKLNTLNNISGKRLLVTGNLNPEEEIEYDLRLWIDEDATTEIAGQEFLAKITIEGNQTNSPVVNIGEDEEE